MVTSIYPKAFIGLLACGLSLVAKAQVVPAGEGPMLRPPPVSGESYRTETGLEQRTNFLRGSVNAGVGYVDNLYPGSSLGQVSETILSAQPRISLDTTSARQSLSASYNPSFVLYEPDSSISEVDHNLQLNFERRFNTRFAVQFGNRFVKSTSGFGQISSGDIPGSTQTIAPVVPLTFGDRWFNAADGGFHYQFGPHGMVGGLGNVLTLRFAKDPVTDGLYNSDAYGGSGFYSQRISAAQYVGAIYGYAENRSYPTSEEFDTKTDTISGFYTIYLERSLSLSISGGPQHYLESYTGQTTAVGGWSPSVTASMGWQGRHTSFAADFSRNVTGGGGLLGSFHTRTAGASAVWQFSRLWEAELDATYIINQDVSALSLTSPGGHSLTGTASLRRTLSRHTGLLFTYDRIQSRYSAVPSTNMNPGSDRVMLSFNWIFERPLGR